LSAGSISGNFSHHSRDRFEPDDARASRYQAARKFSGSGSHVEHGRVLAKAQLIREKIYRIAWVVGSTSLLGVRPRIESLRRGVNFHRNRSVVASSMRTAWLLIEEALAGAVIIVAARAETSLGD
jgi:hypothetical protein